MLCIGSKFWQIQDKSLDRLQDPDSVDIAEIVLSYKAKTGLSR